MIKITKTYNFLLFFEAGMGVEPIISDLWGQRLNRFTHPQFFYSPLFGGQHNQIINNNVITIGINPSVSNVLLLPRWLFSVLYGNFRTFRTVWRWGESNPRLDSNAIKSFTSLVGFYSYQQSQLFLIHSFSIAIKCCYSYDRSSDSVTTLSPIRSQGVMVTYLSVSYVVVCIIAD